MVKSRKYILYLAVFMALFVSIVTAKESKESKESKDLNRYIRKLIKITDQGTFLVEDFYYSGSKLTDPFILEDASDLIIYNLDNQDYTLEDNYNGLSIVGKFVTWYPTGEKLSERNFIDGKLVEQTTWYQNGKIKEKTTYSGGCKIILSTQWYQNGQKKSERNNRAFKVWYKNGQKQLETIYQNNEILSTTSWNEQGQVFLKSKFENGQVGIVYEDFKRQLIKKNSDNTYLVQDFYLNGNKKTTPFILTNKEHVNKLIPYGELSIEGDLTTFDTDGTIVTIEHYKKGILDYIKVWFSNGNKQLEVNYKNGKKEGISTFWHTNGNKYLEVNYKNGVLEGKSLMWYPNGQLQEMTDYSDTGNIISVVKWYENGQKYLEENYKNGSIEGKSLKWYQNGNKQSEMEYKKGILQNASFYSTIPKNFFNIKKINEKLFKIEQWTDNKKILEEFLDDNQQLTEHFRMWYINGQLAIAGNYKNNKKEGVWAYYYEAGKIKMKGSFSAGKQEKNWIYWRDDGEKMKELHFDKQGNVIKEIKFKDD